MVIRMNTYRDTYEYISPSIFETGSLQLKCFTCLLEVRSMLNQIMQEKKMRCINYDFLKIDWSKSAVAMYFLKRVYLDQEWYYPINSMGMNRFYGNKEENMYVQT